MIPMRGAGRDYQLAGLNDKKQPEAQPDFDGFWHHYPRKVGKGNARKAYAKALKVATHDEIMFGLSQQRPSMEATEKRFIPHPATWLNREQWSDDVEDPSNPGPQSTNGNASAQQINDAARIRRSSLQDLF